MRIALALLIVAVVWSTHRAITSWRGEGPLWNTAHEQPRVLLNQGTACAEVGDFVCARERYQKALSAGMKLQMSELDRQVVITAQHNLQVLPVFEAMYRRIHP